MTSSNKSMIDKIHEARRILDKQKLPASLGPTLKQPPPDQEEMDKLASALTEAVLQLRAGDMEGARKTLGDANELCGVWIRGTFPKIPIGHLQDALRYGSSTVKHIYQPPDSNASATEVMLRQQIAERQMRQAMGSINTTLYPSVILSDNTAGPTTPGS